MIKEIDVERVSASGYFHNHPLESCHDGTAPAVQLGLTGNYPLPVSGPADRVYPWGQVSTFDISKPLEGFSPRRGILKESCRVAGITW